MECCLKLRKLLCQLGIRFGLAADDSLDVIAVSDPAKSGTQCRECLVGGPDSARNQRRPQPSAVQFHKQLLATLAISRPILCACIPRQSRPAHPTTFAGC